MAASFVMDMPMLATDITTVAERSAPFEEKIWISQLAPEYNDRSGPKPPDRLVSPHELLRPAILRIPDTHFSQEKERAESLIEMRRAIQPDMVIYGGDTTDQQKIGQGHPLKALHVLYFNMENWLQEKHKTAIIRLFSNHDIKVALSSLTERLAAGLNIFPAARTEHPLKRPEEDYHSHQIEPPHMMNLATDIASDNYDKLATEGEAGAATAKKSTKLTTGAVGTNRAWLRVSFRRNANINKYHSHTVEEHTVDYINKFNWPTIKREIGDFGKVAGFVSALWLHNSGALDNIIKEVLIPHLREAASPDEKTRNGPGIGKRIGNIFRQTASQIVQAAKKDASLEDLVSLKDVRKNLILGAISFLDDIGVIEPLMTDAAAPLLMKFAAAKWKTTVDPKGEQKVQKTFEEVAGHFLKFLETTPHIKLLDGMTLENMTPELSRVKIPAKATATGETAAVIKSFGSFGIDGGETIGVTFADTGETYMLDWRKARTFVQKAANLPETPLSGQPLFDSLIKEFGPELRIDAVQQLAFFEKYKGKVSRDEIVRLSPVPGDGDFVIARMSVHGVESVTMPNGQPLPKPRTLAPHEFVPWAEIVPTLAKINPGTAADFERYIHAAEQNAEAPRLSRSAKFHPKSANEYTPERVPVYLLDQAEAIPPPRSAWVNATDCGNLLYN